jgi:Heavy metal binding domain
MRRAVVWLAMVVGAAAWPVSAQKTAPNPPAAQKLPPVSYICVMAGDEDVLEDKPGSCPKCGMELEGIRLDSVWTCPIHAAVTREERGKCPLDGRDLVQMTMSLSFVCPGTTRESINPGTCADGSPMQRKYSPRPHGNHNPQHGGGFFMAPDNWHHLEGSYFSPGTFRLYLYDDFTKPLTLAQVRATQARLILANDGKEIPLVRNGRFFEARIGKLPFPLAVQAKVKFQPEAPEHHFDFTFEKYSKDAPVPASPATTMTATPAATPAAAPATPVPTTTTATSEGAVDSALIAVPIPETVPEMLAQLRTRNDQIKMFIDRGAFASVYVPAFQAKDVALALDAKKSGLPADRQRLVGPAVAQLLRSAYLLDAFGDLGNKQQIVDAYARFAAAVRDIEAAFPK